MIMYRSAIVVVVVMVSGAMAGPAMMFSGIDEGPSEIANYTVIKQAKTYELRDYGTCRWVCSHVVTAGGNTKNKEKRQMMKMFWELYQYVNGKNSMELEMSMAAPMTMQMAKKGGSMKRIQMCFSIPAALQSNPPQPQDKLVYIDYRHSFKVAARRFNGLEMTMESWAAERDTLESDLKEAGEEGIDFNMPYGAMYNPPMQQEDRRDEVWFVVN